MVGRSQPHPAQRLRRGVGPIVILDNHSLRSRLEQYSFVACGECLGLVAQKDCAVELRSTGQPGAAVPAQLSPRKLAYSQFAMLLDK